MEMNRDFYDGPQTSNRYWSRRFFPFFKENNASLSVHLCEKEKRLARWARGLQIGPNSPVAAVVNTESNRHDLGPQILVQPTFHPFGFLSA